jgi:hypothetical protein
VEDAGAAVHTLSSIARTRQTRESGGGGPRPGTERLDVGSCPTERCDPLETEHPLVRQQAYHRDDRAWDEAQPRCGVTRGGVMRLRQTLGPRSRPAPDGRQSGGSQPTEISVSNRRLFLAPPLPMTQVTGKRDQEDGQKTVTDS